MWSCPGGDNSGALAQVRDFGAHRIDAPSTTVSATKSELLGYFELMYKMRRMEIASGGPWAPLRAPPLLQRRGADGPAEH